MNLLFICVLVTFSVVSSTLMCNRHPMKNPPLQGEIILDWTYSDYQGRAVFPQSSYIPRARVSFAPKDSSTTMQLRDLDAFVTEFKNAVVKRNWITLRFQREAKVYLVVNANANNLERVHLSGWRPEGWYTSQGSTLKYGVGHRAGSAKLPRSAYIFSKTGEAITVPSPEYIKRDIAGTEGFKTNGRFLLLIAEVDGSQVRKPRAPAGMEITAGGLCPSALHDTWVVHGTDDSDPATNRKIFRTWHPIWDPCYRCSYGHEHGSSAPIIMDYWPRYGYTALKNNNQDESHAGFKDIVLDVGMYYVYISVHAHLSQMRRMTARHHTLVIAVAEKKTKKLVAELRFKADFGNAMVRKKNGELYRVTQEVANPKFRRVVNVQDPQHLDPRLRYRKGDRIREGLYEKWSTLPICSTANRNSLPTVDFKDPSTAKRRIGGNNGTQLGRIDSNTDNLIAAAAVDRILRARRWVISASACEFNPHTTRFYTDPFGKILRNGPAPDAVAQFLTKDLRVSIDGDFQPVDPWTGLYKTGVLGKMENIGNGIIETAN